MTAGPHPQPLGDPDHTIGEVSPGVGRNMGQPHPHSHPTWCQNPGPTQTSRLGGGSAGGGFPRPGSKHLSP